jgi:DNA-binding response OmpR family regulator
VFEVTVPRACKQTQTAARADLPKVIQDTRLRGRLIAVIDDDANALNDLRMYYEFLGHEVLAAASGDAAVRQLRTQHRVPDAIVANRSLGRGDGDGGDAIRRIRDATGKPVPGILLTGEPVPDEALHCEGGVLLINKPAAPRELASALDAMLRD